MCIVTDIFAACDAADVRLWREGAFLRFDAPRGLPDALARDLRTHKAALLAAFPDGFGWHRGGAIRANASDLRGVCLRLAERCGWLKLRVELLTDEVVIVGPGGNSWAAFAFRQTEEAVCAALLMLDDIYAQRKRGAA